VKEMIGMTFYAVDSKRQAMRSTGIVNEVFEWIERDGKRKPSETQARDEDTGTPLWAVEVLYRQVSFGRESNTTGTVTVGSPVKPVLAEFAPVAFLGLSVEVRVIKASGSLTESWRAEGLADGKPEDKPPSATQPVGSGGPGKAGA
jgi:hypothetical protein